MAQLIESLELIMIDVGARGGLDSEFHPAAWATRAYGFEPASEECERLNKQWKGPWREVRFLPVALGKVDGPATLFVPSSPVAASILDHNEAMVDRYGHPELHRAEREISVETQTLDSALRFHGIFRVDYLKLDVEGMELDILRSAPKAMTGVSALKVECSFLEQRSGQPLIWEVGSWLQDQGFICADIRDIHRWRRRSLPAHPYLADAEMPYSRGVCAQCDLVFIREGHGIDEESALRLAMVAAIMGYFDHAVTIIRENPHATRAIVEIVGQQYENQFGKIARRIGRYKARQHFLARLRSLISSGRSAFWKGSPAPSNTMKY